MHGLVSPPSRPNALSLPLNCVNIKNISFYLILLHFDLTFFSLSLVPCLQSLVAIKKAYAATGIWPLDPNAIKFDRLTPLLPTAAPPPLPETKPTKNNRITELERKIEELQERVVRLEHPGTAPLASIMKYPLNTIPADGEKRARPKTFKFGTLVTADSIAKELQDIEDAKQKKIDD